ncbi:hypothetical protein V7S43_004034 [Phytophthora oleae]|uniref:Uncharacterized protein n=1 Tax=Phytophthora oleae TaxID=2107226 RepID=A0ABD3G0Y2_9STRA
MAEAAKSVNALEIMVENAFVQFWVNDKQTPAKVLAELRLEATTKTLLFGLFARLEGGCAVVNVVEQWEIRR